MKTLALVGVTLLCTFDLFAQTDITLENGTTSVVYDLREVGDSLFTDQGRFAFRDILYLAKGTARFTYNVVSRELFPVRSHPKCPVCQMGYAYAAKYAGTTLEIDDMRPRPRPELLIDTLFLQSFQDGQGTALVPSRPETRLNARDLQTAPKPSRTIDERTLVVTRQGDTLVAAKRMSVWQDTLYWDGKGQLHWNDVLMILQGRERSILRKGGRLPEPFYAAVYDLSPCSMAIVLAHVYDWVELEQLVVGSLDPRVRQSEEFRTCFRDEQNYLLSLGTKRTGGLKAAAKGASILRTVINVAH